jgi:Ca2+-binding RTX toxin-like protein
VDISGRSLGTNLAGIAQWSTQDPFLDYFKSARSWIPQKPNVWDTQEQALLDLDGNGWLRSLPGPNSTAQFTQVGTIVLPFGEATRPGRYIIQYDGVGSISYALGGAKITAESIPGRDVVQLVTLSGTPTVISDVNQQPILIQINSTDPNNYIRNIRVYHEDDLALVQSGEIFRPEFLQNIKEYGSLRFMDWMNTNSTQTSEWQQRPRVDAATWAKDGVPVEVMVELANRTGENPWFTIPHLASDDYIRQFATYVRDNLAPGLVAYVEYSNEVWNWQFGQTTWAYNQGLANLKDANGNPPTAPNMQWYGVRASQMANIWRDVFRQKAGSPGLKTVFATQSAWQGLESYALEAPNWVAKGNRPPKESFDVYAIAPYFGNEFGTPENQTLVRQWAQEGEAGLAKAFEHMRTGNGGLVGARPLSAIAPELSYHKGVATANGMELAAYEGGQHLVGVLGVENDPILEAFFRRLNNDPRMGQLYTDYFGLWKQSGGNLFSNFSDVFGASKWGNWGNLERWNQTTSPRQEATLNFIRNNPRWWSDGTPNQTVGQFNRMPLAANTMTGTANSDTLLGSAGNDSLIGDAGNDSLMGMAGNDSLDGGVGSDMLQGGAGDDTYIVDSRTDIVLEAVNEGRDAVQASLDFTLPINVEDLVLLGVTNLNGVGNSLDNQLVGNSGNNILTGGTGNDTLSGGEGNDYLDGGLGINSLVGGAGNDTYVVDAADVVIEVVNEGTETIYANGNFTLTANTEHLILQASATNGTGNDLGNFIAANQSIAVTISGLAGNDSLVGNSGNDTILGGADNDSIEGKQGNDTLEGGAGNDTLYGGGDNDTLSGGTEIDYLFGGAGSDSLNGDAGNDVLYGGTENDTLLGGDENDYLSGDAGRDSLVGGTGSDVLYSVDGDGADTLLGGAGDDVYYIDAGDVVIEVINEGTETIYANGNFTLTANTEHLILQASATNGTGNDLGNFIAANQSIAVTISGLAGNDSLVGNSGNDTILGGADNDSIEGKQGNDTLEGGAGNDTLYGGGDNDTLLGGTEDDYLFGEAGVDSLDGGNGNDFLIGGTENDTLLGGADNDYLVGDMGTDFLEGGAGNDTLYGGGDNDTLLGGTENDYLFGDTGSDVLDGGAGNDTLLGGDGNNTLIGGIGNDIYSVNSNGDIVTEAANEGEDLAYAYINYTLTDNVEHLILVGTATNGIGNNSDNFILANTTLGGMLMGSNGNDSLFGGSANDTLSGGLGSDYLVGGNGADEFVFGAPSESFNSLDVDTVSDFTGVDKLVLSKATFSFLTSGIGAGFTTASEFAIVTADADAATSSAIIVYNSTTGSLFYNSNGAAAGFGVTPSSGGIFARLTGNPSISGANFALKS